MTTSAIPRDSLPYRLAVPPLSRQAAAESGCSIEAKDGVVNGVDCQRLDKFEDFVRELVKEGHVANMVWATTP